MNKLTGERRSQVVRCLVEPNSIRSTVRMTGVAKNTIVKLLAELGAACTAHHNRTVCKLKLRRLQCDANWSFVGGKRKIANPEQKADGWGDVWTWTAIDTDTKLCVTWLVGGRDSGSAREFMEDCASRVNSRVRVTIDSHRAYLDAMEGELGMDVDYTQLLKIYGAPLEGDARRNFPATCFDSDMKAVRGDPDLKHARESMRRSTGLTNAVSKKVDNHCHAIALYFVYYNFCRVHQTLRVTPAMEAGIADHVWSVEELIHLLEISN